jgi:cobalt/nickel transport system permease protein
MIGSDRLAQASRWRNRPLAEKTLLAGGLLLLALVLPPWPGGALVLAVALGCALAAGTPVSAWMRLALPPMAFVATGAATLLISLDGDGLALAPDGGARAAAIGLRAAAALASLLLLSVTTPATEIVHGLRRLGLPAEFAEVALATYRFLFVLSDTATAMHNSQAARLGHVGWRRRIRSAGLLAAALLPRALDRAHRLEIGLAARGFDGSLRTLTKRRPADPACLAAIGLLLAAIGGLGTWM